MFRYSAESDVVNAIGQLPFLDEETNTAHALTLARTYMFGANATGDRPGSPNVAIILTDGKPTNGTHISGKDMASAAATKLRDSGVRIVSIGVAQSIDIDLLKNISSPPRVKDQDYFSSPDMANIDSILQGIVKNACPTTATTMHITATQDVGTTTLVQDTTRPNLGTTPIQASTTMLQDTTTTIQDTTRPNMDTTQIQDKTTPIKVSTSPNQGETSPIQGETSPIQGSTSPIQGSTSPIQGATSHAPETTTILTPFHDPGECNSKSCQLFLL